VVGNKTTDDLYLGFIKKEDENRIDAMAANKMA
jgi:hypothetical protein